jgi:hypothetical protein
MKLKEKFAIILMEFWSSDWESKCEQEAEEFATGFAEWILDLKLWQNEIFIKNSTEKLLEIYKKEKGL